MRVKKFDRKLALNKKTIVHLDQNAMDSAKGGTDYTDMSCNTACFVPDTLCVGVTGYTRCRTCQQSPANLKPDQKKGGFKMRVKKLDKKLMLNKKNIACLDDKTMDTAKGGYTDMSCNTRCIFPISLCYCPTYDEPRCP